MLERSETFRQQCRRIAEIRSVHIWVRINPLIDIGSVRARSTIDRYRSGPINAVVEVSIRGPVEWIAHEFEHVAEQIEGVDVTALANHHAGAWRTGEAMWETTRAIAAGRAVVREMRADPRRSDRFVE